MLGDDSVCHAESHEGQRVPLDMYFLVDSSRSMEAPIPGGGSRWDAVSGALIDFLGDAKNVQGAVGLGFFPLVPLLCQNGNIDDCFILTFCDVDDYSKPAVSLALPSDAARLVTILQLRDLAGGTPTRAALEGAVKYVTTWATMHPDRKSVIVLATDGVPGGCEPNTTQDVADVAASALASPAAIRTFVIGVGSSLDALSLVAKAGGTEKAYLVEDSNAATAFADALEKIRSVAAPCDFLIPEQGSKVDPTRLNVKYTPARSTTATLLAQTSDGSASTCGAACGWHYDNPQSPKSIQLCPTTCQALGSGSVQVEFGCQTLIQPPR
jgi:hypothetical protein